MANYTIETIEGVIERLNAITEEVSFFSEKKLKVYTIKIKMSDLREFLISLAKDGWAASDDLKEGHLIDGGAALAMTYHDTLTVCQVRHPVKSVSVVDRYRLIYRHGMGGWAHIARLEENDC